HVAVELDIPVHIAQRYIADHVVDMQQSRRTAYPISLVHGNVTWQEHTAILPAFDESMNSLSVGRNRRELHLAIVIRNPGGLLHAFRAALCSRAPSLLRVVHG